MKPRIFCRRCGGKLLPNFIFSHYDQETGEPKYIKNLRCENWAWWNFFIHDNFYVYGGAFGTAPQYYSAIDAGLEDG